MAGIVSTEFSTLFSQALDARFHLNSTRSVGDQLLDVLAIEVASAQSEPETVLSA